MFTNCWNLNKKENKMKNNEKKRFGRRATGTAIWAIIMVYIFNLMVFRNLGLEFFTEPAKYFTLGLLIAVTGLSATDIVKLIVEKWTFRK